jgi:hypothetical protein
MFFKKGDIVTNKETGDSGEVIEIQDGEAKVDIYTQTGRGGRYQIERENVNMYEPYEEHSRKAQARAEESLRNTRPEDEF